MSTAVEKRPLGANYRKLFASAVSANLGDGLMAIAVVWLASALTRDPLVIALIGLLSRLPWLVFTLPAGVIADRVDRRLLVAWMDVVRFALIAGFGLVVLRFQDTIPTPEDLATGTAPPSTAPLLLTLLGALALLLGFAEVLRDNTAQTLMPAVVHKSQLEKANGRMWGAETAMNNFVGPPLGGVLIAAALALPFLINAGLLAVSGALVFALVGSFRPAGHEQRSAKIAWRAEIGEGFRWLWKHPLLRALALLLGGMNMLSSLAFVVLVLFVQDVLGREWALRAPLLVAAVLTLSLLLYAVGRVGTAQIRAAEAEAAAAEGSAVEQAEPVDEAIVEDEASSAVGDDA